MCKAWPDRGDDYRDAFAAVRGLDAEPKQGQDASRDDAEVAQPVSERSTGSNREGYVEVSTDGTVEDCRNGVAQCGGKCDQDRIGSGQACGQDRACHGPPGDRHQIRKPVPCESPSGLERQFSYDTSRDHESISYPCPLVKWYRILICFLSVLVPRGHSNWRTLPALTHTYSGAMLEDCFGRAQLAGSRKRVLALLKEASTPSRRDVICMVTDFMVESTRWVIAQAGTSEMPSDIHDVRYVPCLTPSRIAFESHTAELSKPGATY